MSRISVNDPVVGVFGQSPFDTIPASDALDAFGSPASTFLSPNTTTATPAVGSFDAFTPSTNITIDDPIIGQPLAPFQPKWLPDSAAITIDDPFVGEDGKAIPKRQEPTDPITKQLLKHIEHFRGRSERVP